jgi:hypothetical protein
MKRRVKFTQNDFDVEFRPKSAFVTHQRSRPELARFARNLRRNRSAAVTDFGRAMHGRRRVPKYLIFGLRCRSPRVNVRYRAQGEPLTYTHRCQ